MNLGLGSSLKKLTVNMFRHEKHFGHSFFESCPKGLSLTAFGNQSSIGTTEYIL